MTSDWVSLFRSETLKYGMPSTRAVVVGLLCAFVATRNGRQLAAHVIFKNIQKLLLHLPLKTRCAIVRKIFLMPFLKGRAAMARATRVYGYQWNWVVPVKKDGEWSGHWVMENAYQYPKGWVEETAHQADLVIYYIHGGGFRLGHSLMYINSFINILKRLKKKHGISARIFAVDYRMVPEFTYPTPGEDCMAAYSYLVNDLSINPRRIIIGGDSAGGNLTATTLLHLLDHSRVDSVISLGSSTRLPLPVPAGAVMISPWVTLENTSPTYKSKAATDCIPYELLASPVDWYVPELAKLAGVQHEALLKNPDVSPLYGNFEGLCPVLVTYGGAEVFSHDIENFINRLQRDHVQVDVITRPDCPHDWIIEPFLSPTADIWLGGLNQLTDWCAATIEKRN